MKRGEIELTKELARRSDRRRVLHSLSNKPKRSSNTAGSWLAICSNNSRRNYAVQKEEVALKVSYTQKLWTFMFLYLGKRKLSRIE